MSALYELHRPARLADVVGQGATVQAVTSLIQNPSFSGGAMCFIGKSGQGKTSIGRALLAELKVEKDDIFTIGGADCGVDFVRNLQEIFNLSSWGESGWKAVQVDESHAMSKVAVQAWLPYLEALPKKRIVIFTSTESFESDIFGNFAAPLASRCKVFHMKLDIEAAAAHIAAIASKAGLDGRPVTDYIALLNAVDGNMRTALQKIEVGEMKVEPKTEKAKVSKREKPELSEVDALKARLVALEAGMEEMKAVVMASTVLRDVQKIAVPTTQHAPGSATASKRDWSKVPTAKLQELAAKTFEGSPKNKAVRAELTARGIE